MIRPSRTLALTRALPLVLACAAVPRGALAQADSATVVPGPGYRPRSALHESLLGTGWRGAWTTPVRVPVLDLGTFAGGLTPVRRGGNVQTLALRFRGADGREYNFRSVDKEYTPALPPYARETLVDWIRQDQTAAQLPTAPVVAAALLDAAGVLHPGPRLVVMPDDPRLGEFRVDFAGQLGTIELHADEGEEGAPGFAGADAVSDTESLLEHLEESPDHRLDDRAYLRARLMDVFLGDWDRHEGQWRWARYQRDGAEWWVPVPEDRDYAFVNHDGLLLSAARGAGLRRLVRFRETYPGLLAMMDNSLELNQRLLAGLPRTAWDSVALDLQRRLTDSVIAAAVRALPPPHHALVREELERTLRARRDRLPGMAARYYRLMAHTVEVHGTDQPDRAEVARAADGSVEVRILSGTDRAEPVALYRRTFSPAETEEVRIHLHGGDDSGSVSGGAGEIVVRLVGGGGDDALEDRARGPTVLYDDRGDNRFVRGPRTRVSREAPYEPEVEAGLLPRTLRDWGSKSTIFGPHGGWHPHAQLVVGGGPAVTRYGFRRFPHRSRLQARGLWAPLEGRFAVEAAGDFRPESSPARLAVLARASQLEAVRFHGFGNDVADAGQERARVWQDQLLLSTTWSRPLSDRVEGWLGGRAEYLEAQVEAGTPAAFLRPYGIGGFGQAAVEGGVAVDTRDSLHFPRRGARVEMAGAAFPPLWDVEEPFGRMEARAAAYAALGGPRAPVLALRAGGAGVAGRFPFHEAAFLGGGETLRGYHYQRFAGDVAVHGGAELRVPLVKAEIVLRGDLGVLGFGDAGRVWHRGRSPGGWHTSTGGGLFFATPPAAFSAWYAYGEEGRFGLSLGLPF